MALAPQQIGIAEKIVSGDAGAINQRLAAPHGLKCLPFFFFTGIARQAKKWQRQASDDLIGLTSDIIRAARPSGF